MAFSAALVRRCLLGGLAAALIGCGSGAGDKAESPATSGAGGTAVAKDAPTIAFIVKQPEEPWFQLEWKFADQAAKDLGFNLVKLDARQGSEVIPKIETAVSQGAKGLIICTPDVRLGPAMVEKAKEANLKLMTVDDRLVDAENKPLDVPHLGISARKIGATVGEALNAEMKKRGWNVADTALLLVTRDELDTAKERTQGASEALVKAGFPAARIFPAPVKTTDVKGSRDAATPVLTQHPEVKRWLIASMNDSGILGAVRATESFNIRPENVIAIGINGDTGVIDEFKKSEPSGVFGSILLQARRHGYDTSKMMYEWVKNGKEPPKITYTDGVLITRDNYESVMKDQGLTGS